MRAEVLRSAPNSDRRAPRCTPIVLCSNTAWNLVNFRGPIIAALVADGRRVIAAAAPDGTEAKLAELGAEFHPLPVEAASRNPLHDIRLFLSLAALLRKTRPSVLLTFTVKPNIYGTLAARLARVRAIATVSGLGSAFLGGGKTAKLVERLYRLAFKDADSIFFQNDEDRNLFLERKLVSPAQVHRVPGSGVDLDEFRICELPGAESPVFVLIGRMLRDKGVTEFVEAARLLSGMKPAPRFVMVGGSGVDNPSAVPISEIERWVSEGTIEYAGVMDDVRPAIEAADCVVLPSYREGLPRSLLEGAAMGRPLIASDVPGCRDVVEHGVNGYLCAPRSSEALADAMRMMADLSAEERTAMGLRGHEKIKKTFAVSRVIAAYQAELQR